MTTARCFVAMKKIVCTTEGVEMRINTNMVGRAAVMFIKTMKTGKGGGQGSKC